jgi:hypothetical protein
MTETAAEILARAQRREEAREAAYKPIDYTRMNRDHRNQKAALTRAVNSADRDKVVLACAKAVREWDDIGAWPDDWSRWQNALDDVFPVFFAPRLEDLR